MELKKQIAKKNDYVFVACVFSTILLWMILLMCGQDSQLYVFHLQGDMRFNDFSDVLKYAINLDTFADVAPYGHAERAYMPICYVLFYLLGKPFTTEQIVTGFFTGGVTTLAAVFMLISSFLVLIQVFVLKKGSNLIKFLFSLAILLSGISLYSFERGNLVVLTLALSMFFILNHDNPNKIVRELSFIALALAAAMKLSPAIFGVLLISKGRWKEAVRTVIYGIVLAFVPFLIMHGNPIVNIQTYLNGISLNTSRYMGSIGCRLPSVASLVSFENRPIVVETILNAVSAVLCLLIFFALPLIMDKWKMVLALTMLCIMVPTHSGIYNLIYVIPSIVLFFDREDRSFTDIIYAILFVLALSPLQLPCLTGISAGGENLMPFVGSAMLILVGIESLILLFKNASKLPSIYGNLIKEFLCISKNKAGA